MYAKGDSMKTCPTSPPPMYVLTRCKSKIGYDRHKMAHFGTEHKTLCGKVVDDMWWIEPSRVLVSCPKCKAKMDAWPGKEPASVWYSESNHYTEEYDARQVKEQEK